MTFCWNFFYNYMILHSMKCMNLYFYYQTLSTPGDLKESSYIVSNWISLNSSSLDILYIYIYMYIYKNKKKINNFIHLLIEPLDPSKDSVNGRGK